jgi:amidase
MEPNRSGELIALLAEFKLSINDYLEELINSTVKSLSDIIAFNLNNSVLVSS